MKPLLSSKITTATKNGLGDWIPAKDQATVDGCSDFLQRQRDRIKAAQNVRQEQVEKVRPMARKTK